MDEDADETVEAMAAAYLEEMRRVQPAGPYRLGGWSLGGVVAFEMARRLEEQGEAVALLAVLDAVAPGVLPPVEINDGLILRGFLGEIQSQGYDLGIREEDLQGLSTEEGMKLVLRRSQEAGALPADFGVDQALRLWRVVRANLLSVQAYRPGTCSASALLFVVADPARPDPGPDLGWRPFLQGGIESLTVEARHSTMLHGEALQTIAGGLRERL
jgi:thioesterase domain-containing protein